MPRLHNLELAHTARLVLALSGLWPTVTVTEEDVRTFFNEFQVDQVRFLPFVTTIIPSITFAHLKGAA